MNNNYQLNIEKIEDMIKRSEKELIELVEVEDTVGVLRENLHLKRKEVERGQKFDDMKLLTQFFESGKTDLMEYKAIEKIKADLEEESKPKDYSMIELVYSQKLINQERH